MPRLTTILSFAALFALVALAACNGLSPEQQAEQISLAQEIAEIGRLVRAGAAQAEDFTRLADALTRQAELHEIARQSGESGVSWPMVITGVASVAASIFGVELRRGSPSNRKGLPPKAAT